MGKSRVLEMSWPEIEATAVAQGDRALCLNLGEYGNEMLLVNDLFGPTGLGGWDSGAQRLHLYLDSLDECQVRIGQLTLLLATHLGRFPSDRLLLRIICRSVDWPATFEEHLRAHWGDVGVHELAPLREADVELAARAYTLEPADFLREVQRQEAVGFARKPLTLKFLLQEFHERRALPRDRGDLYLKGCRHLCQETPTRLEAGLATEFDLDQLLAVSGRIAAVTIFSGRPLVVDDALANESSELYVTASDLQGGVESINGRRFEVTPRMVSAALRTGLFSPRGESRFAWAHHSYAAFLAALHTARRQIEPGQVRDLLFHPDGKLVPQLREPAGWLATMDGRTLAEMIAAEPEVVVGADMGRLPDGARAAAAEALLRAYDAGTAVTQPWEMRADYRTLDHPGLAEQVRPFLRDASRSDVSRRVAIDIASACRLVQVQDELVALALDGQARLSLRADAALALAEIGDREARERLLPLLDPIEGDPDEELRGAVLRALWPSVLSASELFATLPTSQESALFGNFFVTLHSHVLPHLRVDDIPLAIEWASRVEWKNGLGGGVEDLAHEILALGLLHVREGRVRAALARALVSRPAHEAWGHVPHDRNLQAMLEADDEGRRLLARAVFDNLNDPVAGGQRLWGRWPRLVVPRDLPWLIEELRKEPEETRQRALARIIGAAWDRSPEQASEIWTAAQSIPALAAEFRDLIEGVELNSERANELRELHKHTACPSRTLLDPPPSERVRHDLDRFDSGERSAFLQLMRDLTLSPDSTHYEEGLDPDLTTLPGWQDALPDVRARLIDAAARFLLDATTPVPLRTEPGKVQPEGIAGYKALRLLAQEALGRLDALPERAWENWAEVVIDYPGPFGGKDRDPDLDIAARALQVVPDALLTVLRSRVRREGAGGESLSPLWKFRGLEDRGLAEALAECATDPVPNPKVLGEILEMVFSIAPDLARPIEERYLSLPIPTGEQERERALAVGVHLALQAADAGWPRLWPTIQADPDFGRELVGRIAEVSPGHGRALAARLAEPDLAALYLWIHQNFPPAPPTQWGVAHAVDTREMVDMLQSEVLQQLQERGTRYELKGS